MGLRKGVTKVSTHVRDYWHTSETAPKPSRGSVEAAALLGDEHRVGPCQCPTMSTDAAGARRLFTGPKTAEGLERSRRARWKHGHRLQKPGQNGARFERKRSGAGRWTAFVPKADRLFHLLNEIACQVEANNATELTARYANGADGWWRGNQSLLNTIPQDKRTRVRWRRETATDRVLVATLGGGRRRVVSERDLGEGGRELSCNGTVA
jgi:hypothetical protein